MDGFSEAQARAHEAHLAPADASKIYWRISPSHDFSLDFPRGRRIVGGALKRAFDFLAASCALIVLAPVFALIVALIKVLEPGPAFFHHDRVGARGRIIKVCKFRSMRHDSENVLSLYLASNAQAEAEWRRTRKLCDDPRVTRFGAFLRQYSVDELPQLINVVRGDMSLVGPRPVLREELLQYGLDRLHYVRTRPGITGVWQISGRSNVRFAQRVAMDRDYVTRWSFGRDLLILLRTIPAVLFSKGAY
jgi:exopolysaccharide production protein ExoY